MLDIQLCTSTLPHLHHNSSSLLGELPGWLCSLKKCTMIETVKYVSIRNIDYTYVIGANLCNVCLQDGNHPGYKVELGHKFRTDLSRERYSVHLCIINVVLPLLQYSIHTSQNFLHTLHR